MTTATLAVQSVSVPGIELTMTAPNGAGAGNGNTYTWGQNTYLIVDNKSGGGTRTITFQNIPGTKIDGVTLPSLTRTVQAGKIGICWVPPEYRDSSGNVEADIDSLDSGNVKWAAANVPPTFQ